MTTRQKQTAGTKAALAALDDKPELDGKTQRQINADLLNSAVLLDMTIHRWTNRVKTDALPESTNRTATEKARQRLRTTMRLIESPAYDLIMSETNKTHNWVLERCMPSYLVNGIYFIKLDVVEEFERELERFNTWLDTEGIPALQRDWERAKQQARDDFTEIAQGLGIKNPYRDVKYPDPTDLRRRFGIDHNWITFGVPDSLPRAIREREEIKIQARFDEAAQKIEDALYAGIASLVTEATNLLTATDGEKKIIRQPFVDSFNKFCEMFRFRNLTNNRALETIVQQAESIMSGVDAATLRDKPRVRADIVKKLSAVKAEVDRAIIAAPKRKINLDELDG